MGTLNTDLNTYKHNSTIFGDSYTPKKSVTVDGGFQFSGSNKGHDSLAAMVKNKLRKDQFTGTIFVLRTRKADRLNLLYWDSTELVMAYKQLEEHTFT